MNEPRPVDKDIEGKKNDGKRTGPEFGIVAVARR
jgi:hypothetical protein